MLVLIDTGLKQFSVINSIPGAKTEHIIFEKFYVNCLTNEEQTKWSKFTIISPQQSDGHSCGLFVLQNAFCLLNNKNLNYKMDPIETRKSLMSHFLKNISPVDGFCPICCSSGNSPTDRPTYYKCIKCDTWYKHAKNSQDTFINCKNNCNGDLIPSSSSWQQCGMCLRWLHFECDPSLALRSLSPASLGDPNFKYFCVLCELHIENNTYPKLKLDKSHLKKRKTICKKT